MSISKRQKAISAKVEAGKVYSFSDAVAILKDVSSVKFDESVDVSINLGIDARKSDQNVRGSVVMPNGTGKKVRVAVFTQGAAAEAALAAGADEVGMEDLAEKIKAGDLDFQTVIASPDAMRVVGQLGQVLGPRGLMPNPKVGTVTPDVATAVKNAKAGQVRFRNDKAGIVHASVGKLAFDGASLQTNVEALLAEVKKLKPAQAKGVFLKKVSISSTMGPGLSFDVSSVNV
jgi:large subunit ribosomal protein L1